MITILQTDPCKDYQTDFELLEGLKKQKTDALECIYKKNYPSFEHYVKMNHGSPSDAEDAFQNGLIKFYTNAISGKYVLDPKAKMATVIFDYCKKIWLTELGSARRKKDTFYDDTIEVAEESNTLEDMVKDDTLIRLQKGLEQIGKDCKKLLMHYYFDDLSLRAISDLMGITEETAKSKKYQCTKRIKAIIKN